MKNLSLGWKLVMLFAAVIMLVVFLGVFGIISLRALNEKFTSFYENSYELTRAVEESKSVLLEMDNDMMKTCYDPQAVDINTVIAELKEHSEALSDCMKKIQKIDASDEDVKILSSHMEEFKNGLNTLIGFAQAGQISEAQQYFTDKYQPIVEGMNSHYESLVKTSEARGDKDYNRALSKGKNTVNMTIVISLFIILCTLVIEFVIYIIVVKNIKNLKKAVDRMATGDLSEIPEGRCKDEIGQLTDSVGIMMKGLVGYINEIDRRLVAISEGDLTTENAVEFIGDFKQIGVSLDEINDTMNKVVAEISQTADQVNSGSEQVAAGAQLLAQGATEQASSVQEVSSTINLCNEQIKGNAEKASEANIKATTIRSEAEDSRSEMVKMVGAMEDISTRSNEIAKIIKTIDDIAFNTNILALNAAVEAARAGSAGKGFAVVAEEVRNLASKSQEAAANTTELIRGAISAVENGTKIAQQTADSLNTVVSGVEEISEAVSRISNATNEQASTMGQVALAVDQISDVVQTTSATAEESAASSEELSAQAGVLQELVAKFTLKQEDPSFAKEIKLTPMPEEKAEPEEAEEKEPQEEILRIGVSNSSKY